ncbi:MAG: dynamin family protein [Gammaproteobacteria bacterium]|nr:dynamin family protein [Gammaproteobacteria bacterium]
MIDNRIEQEFDAYGHWRSDLKSSIVSFRDWLTEQKLGDVQTEQRLDQALIGLRDDKLYVAFVAEFSRGKSELINATFFGQLGRRVLPSSAGRTTMCPTELIYEEDSPAHIQLLPIETRSTYTTIAEYKTDPDEWSTIALDLDDPDQVSEALDSITEVKLVSQDQARELGLPIARDTAHDDGMRLRADGLVEIPRWRHAVINFPHPLLEQGLVILDTPGLNALGIEPELTINMLSAAHAVVFILAADAGVTKSDLVVWRDHISGDNGSSKKGQLVVLNKIDVLWDELKDRVEVDHEILRQISSTARTLDVPEENIYPVSAQKALLGKIKGDQTLVENSKILALEDALANVLVPRKRDIVRENVESEIIAITDTIRGMVEQRLKDVHDHLSELDNLSSNNMEVIEDIMSKVRSDKENLEKNLQRFQATRSIFSQLTHRLYEGLSMANLERMIAQGKKEMETSLTTAGLRRNMVGFFDEIRVAMAAATDQANEIQALMEGVYKKFHEEHGIANVKPRRFSTKRYQRELKRLEDRHEHFLRGMSMVMTEQWALIRKFHESVVSKTRQIFERANRDVDNWLKTIMSPMESQVREHQMQLRRRLESIKRIHKASDTLEDRTAELHLVREGIAEQNLRMQALTEEIKRCLDGESWAENYRLENTA